MISNICQRWLDSKVCFRQDPSFSFSRYIIHRMSSSVLHFLSYLYVCGLYIIVAVNTHCTLELVMWVIIFIFSFCGFHKSGLFISLVFAFQFSETCTEFIEVNVVTNFLTMKFIILNTEQEGDKRMDFVFLWDEIFLSVSQLLVAWSLLCIRSPSGCSVVLYSTLTILIWHKATLLSALSADLQCVSLSGCLSTVPYMQAKWRSPTWTGTASPWWQSVLKSRRWTPLW